MPEPCQHAEVVPVIQADGEYVGDLCVACLAALDPGYGCPHCSWEDVQVSEYVLPVAKYRVAVCPAHVPR